MNNYKKKTLNNSKYKNCIHVKNYFILRSHILKSLPVTYVTSAFQQKYILNVFYSKNTFVRFCILKNIEREKKIFTKNSID